MNSLFPFGDESDTPAGSDGRRSQRVWYERGVTGLQSGNATGVRESGGFETCSTGGL